MLKQADDLWSLVLDHQHVDADALAEAVEARAAQPSLDFRTRLLIRDSVNALAGHWEGERFRHWLAGCPARERIEAIRREDLGKPGFPFLPQQIMDTTKPETIRQLFRELGQHLHHKVRIHVGGSGALILKGYLSRRTQDIAVVNELPPEIRKLSKVLDQLEQSYRLKVAHFQSHYLPTGWEQRVHSLEPFGQLQVQLVDVYDIFLSKLNSTRQKDKEDLRELAPQLDKETLVRRLKDTCAAMLATEALRKRAEQNWYILYGEPLPHDPDSVPGP
jgi:hypothetical protein